MTVKVILDVITAEPIIYYGADALIHAVFTDELRGLYIIGDSVYFFSDCSISDQYGNQTQLEEIFYKHENENGELYIIPLSLKPE